MPEQEQETHPHPPIELDVLCVGNASYDLTFGVERDPEPDEKVFAETHETCGGGPAANAALTAARLGCRAAFAGYLGRDLWGERNLEEMTQAGVRADWIVRGDAPTPLTVSIVKPGGSRMLVNYRGRTEHLPAGSIDFSRCAPRVVLFDGHEPRVSMEIAEAVRAARTLSDVGSTGAGRTTAGAGSSPGVQRTDASREGDEPPQAWDWGRVQTVLDAGSVHPGTRALVGLVDYLVCSEKFARDFTGAGDPERAAGLLLRRCPRVVVTLGARGLAWASADGAGRVPAFEVKAVDSTGAGDVFHGAFAACLALGWPWLRTLRFASAVAALSCTRLGSRSAIPTREEAEAFLRGSARSTD